MLFADDLKIPIISNNNNNSNSLLSLLFCRFVVVVEFAIDHDGKFVKDIVVVVVVCWLVALNNGANNYTLAGKHDLRLEIVARIQCSPTGSYHLSKKRLCTFQI